MSMVGDLVVAKFYPLMDRFLPKGVALKIKLVFCVLHGDWQFCNFCSEDLAVGLSESAAEEKLAKLLSGLDAESADLVKRLVGRIALLCRMRHSLLLKPSSFFWEEELAEQRRWARELPALASKYKLPETPVEVVAFHNGMTLLPPAAINYLARKDFLDVGAYVGDSAVVFMEYGPRKVYSFDISTRNKAKYLATMEANHLSTEKYEFVLAAVGDKDGGEMSFADTGAGDTNLGTSGSSKAPACTLDSFAAAKGLDVGLVKFDVEGFGLQATRGMVETLKRHRPVLLLSIYHNSDEFFEIKPFIEALGLGYKFKLAKLNPFHLVGELTLLGYPGELAEKGDR